MSTLALQRDALMPPRSPGGMRQGLILALLVHAALVVALAFGVHWHASEREGVEAELWAAVPQIAAPRAVEPEPAPVVVAPPPRPAPKTEAPPDAQIAIERAKREEQLRKKEELAQKQAQEEKLEAQRKKEEDAKLAALREKNLKRMMGQAGATGDTPSTGTATRTAGPSASYAGRIKARIRPNIVFTGNPSDNPVAEVEITLAPDGQILSQKLLTPSGLAAWDDAVQRAITRTAILPRDIDGRIPPTMTISLRPHD